MPFTAQELANITNSALDFYMEKGKVFKQNIQQKPLVAAFDGSAGTFPGGRGNISLAVKAGQGGGSLGGFTHDDQVTYYNPANTKRINYVWREHHIGIGLTHTELKHDGITVVENGADSSTSEKDGREQFALANILDEKMDEMAEDYVTSLNSLLWGDGTADAKALAGIRALLTTTPSTGSTGGLSRSVNAWWRNRAPSPVASNVASGGALLQFLQTEQRQIRRYAQGGVRHKCFAGSDFIAAMETELRANGNYSDRGWGSKEAVDGMMNTVEGGIPFGPWTIVYDPTLDDLSLQKSCYVIDMKRIKLMYMSGEKMKKTMPARPYDRYVWYTGLTTTCALVAQQLNTSAIYRIS